VLSNETMGAFCLAVVWVNTLLIAAHVWQTQRALGIERRALGNVVRASVLDTRDAASLATLHVAQIGRAITEEGPNRILFTEASRRSEVHPATIEIGGDEVELVPSDGVRVWCLGGAARHDEDFDRAFGEARTSRGYKSEVDVGIGAAGSTVWVAGTRDGATLRATLVSDRDPAAVVGSARARAIVFVVASLVMLALVSALALTRPWFEGWSTLGGVLAVAYFLGVQPIANALRESMASPPERPIGGLWERA
jgi:hypothetical protein